MKTLRVCETWDLTQLSFPSRSRLYSLEPIGVGTAYVESLTGYVTRLAEAHHVSPRLLVVREIWPLLDLAYLSDRENRGTSTFWTTCARALNGTQTWAAEWVRVLEALTGRRDVRALTMLTWANVLPARGLLRAQRAWCPTCYDEWLRTKQVVYERLLWTLEPLKYCAQHQQRLITQCPHCQASQPVLNRYSQPGHCSRCGRWLGVTPASKQRQNKRVISAELAWQKWVGEKMGEMLAAAAELATLPAASRIAEGLATLVELVSGGNGKLFAQLVGRSVWSVNYWRRGLQLPQLDVLLEICYRFRVTPLQFLTDKNLHLERISIRPPLISKSAPQAAIPRQSFDGARLGSELQMIISRNDYPPQSWRQVAKHLHHDSSHLKRLFPESFSVVSKRFHAYRVTQSQEVNNRIRDEVRAAVLKIHAKGKYPSSKQMRATLGKPGCMRSPVARSAWTEMLRELGLQD